MKITKDTKDFLRFVGAIGLIGVAGTAFSNLYDWARKPIYAYDIDANGDRKRDLLLQNRIGGYEILLKQEDGTYKFLSTYPKAVRDSIEARLK